MRCVTRSSSTVSVVTTERAMSAMKTAKTATNPSPIQSGSMTESKAARLCAMDSIINTFWAGYLQAGCAEQGVEAAGWRPEDGVELLWGMMTAAVVYISATASTVSVSSCPVADCCIVQGVADPQVELVCQGPRDDNPVDRDRLACRCRGERAVWTFREAPSTWKVSWPSAVVNGAIVRLSPPHGLSTRGAVNTYV